MSDFRKNAVVGLVEHDGLAKVSLHFSEWYNGEGADFEFLGDDRKKFSLHTDEIHALIVASRLLGMVDSTEIEEDVQKIKQDTAKRKKDLKKLISQYKHEN